ncbi:2OG-Fe(II) oxygenase [Pelomonas sp. BJYL3]|uniref:2OG-Fe(II) oxygenase n=1 Tax=Pelomonas sp. BJYL3 TaxID=2976697 RepID=UPI0022B2D18D|nr:2OG-Fe(II) oxygenase [Pelomonas sp. BJYL3]
MNLHRLGAGVFTIADFLSPEECAHYISRSERMGYSEAAVRTDDGDRLHKEARNNDRVVFDDADLAHHLFSRARPLLPAVLDGWQLSGFNERFRYYRYDRDQQFTWHLDGTVRLSPSRESVLTFMVYLNDDFEGGSTEFGWESVKPVRGMALGFPHRLRHQGAAVRSGLKYVLRTDVLYDAGDAT